MPFEVERTESESTDRLVDASILLESLWGVESRNFFPDVKGNLLPLTPAITCPSIFLQSPARFSYSIITYHIFKYCGRNKVIAVCASKGLEYVLLCTISTQDGVERGKYVIYLTSLLPLMAII